MPVTLGGQGGGGFPPLLNSYEEFTSSGTFTVPSGVTSVLVTMVGGGGAGGGSYSIATSGYAGGGGGSGGCAYYLLPVEVTPGDGITVTIGAGGTGVSAGNGGDGGNTSFGDIVVLGGLGGGVGGTSTGAGGIAQGSTLYSSGNQQYEYYAMGPYKYPAQNGSAGYDDGGSAANAPFYSPILGYLQTADISWTPSVTDGNGGVGGATIFGLGGAAGDGSNGQNGSAPLAGCYGAGGGGAGHKRTGLGGGARQGGDGLDGYVIVRWV